jgi:putative SOS response-associated peptidase YedK
MCGRFMQAQEVEALRERFRVREVRAQGYAPSINVAPTMPVAVVREDQGRVLELHRWGLVPSWARSLKDGPRPINAKAETLARSGMFRRLLAGRRCLVPAGGFYEWTGPKAERRPVSFKLRGGEVFAFAALWDLFRDPAQGGEPVRSFTIITCPANALVEPIHDRMPAILRPEDEARWLDPALEEEVQILALLRPFEAEAMVLAEVTESLKLPRLAAPAKEKAPVPAGREEGEEPRQRMLPGFGPR